MADSKPAYKTSGCYICQPENPAASNEGCPACERSYVNHVAWPYSVRCEFCGEILPQDDPFGGLCQGCIEDSDEPGSDPVGYQ